MGIDILATTTDLRADDHTTVAVLHLAVADDDVLRGNTSKGTLTTLTTIVVTTTLDGDAVVASIEETVLYQYTLATLWVAAITVRTIVIDMYTTHSDVL